MSMSYLDLAKNVLTKEKKALTINDIWILAQKYGYDKQLKSKGKTPKNTLSARIHKVLKRTNSDFGQTNDKPKKVYLKSQANQLNLPETIISNEFVDNDKKMHIKKKLSDLREKDLHPFLAYYAFHRFKCYTKTIDASQSSKKIYGEWVHPDMVGFYLSRDQWQKEVYDLSKETGNISFRLFSFELKRELSFTNLREGFFQAVSNSSWANEGYLVAAEISNDEKFLNELSRLSSSFGIGVIKLNLDNPSLSEIIFPAKYRENLDWETINKLTEMNKDFKEFIIRITGDFKIGNISEKYYDPILKPEELKEKLK